MKNFDTQRAERAQADCSFQIGGEVFVRRPSVRPEATQPWEDISAVSTQSETLKAIDDTIMNLVEPGAKGEAHKRWATLRQREEDAVTLGDLLELIQWLVEEQTGRPTEPPPNSSEERAADGTSSTDDSSSPETPEASTD